jgi:hypothetical protein
MQSSGMSSRGSRIPAPPSAVPARDEATNMEPTKKFSGRSPATLPVFGWKKKAKYKNIDSDYHRAKK